MGAVNSKVEEDKALLLCRERKKFVKQALDGRCSLAEAHVAYIHSLKATGTALRKFAEPLNEPSLYTPTSATPEPLPLTEKSLSRFSFSSPSFSHHIDATESTVSPSPSPPITTHFRADHMRFRGNSSKEVEERISSPATGTVIFSNTPPGTTPRLANRPNSSPSNDPHIPPQTPPWDFFGLFHLVDHQFSFQEGKEMNSIQGAEDAEHIRMLREVEGIPDLEDDEEKSSSHEIGGESHDSENEFDEPSTDTLIRRFENVNRLNDQRAGGLSPSNTVPPVGSVASEDEFLNVEGGGSPDTSSLRDASSAVTPLADEKKEVDKDHMENNIEPKDFVTSIRHIELLFVKASESGKEVPRMLEVEANKLQLSLSVPAKESVSSVSIYLRACFSCGQERRQVQEEPARAAIKYLTWHNMVSPSPSSSNPLELNSRDNVASKPLELNPRDNVERMNSNLFDNFCMASGSHASTLDRLYAWERKLYDEVKASEIIRKNYDSKCKILRQLESKAQSSQRIEKTRADIKDLHSRIRVAIQRIESISKKIEELRDKELQPQLEELIEGLSRMWEVMFKCHQLQCRIIAVAHSNKTKVSLFSESWRWNAVHLENELNYLSSNFTRWIGSQEFYLGAIKSWLVKCVFLQQRPSKKRKKAQTPSLSKSGPPIYTTCEVWLSKLGRLPSKELTYSIAALAAEARKFSPRQEKSQGKGAKRSPPTTWEADNIRDGAPEDLDIAFDQFRLQLVEFLGKLSDYSESSVNMYRDLRVAIVEAKNNYSRFMSRSQT